MYECAEVDTCDHVVVATIRHFLLSHVSSQNTGKCGEFISLQIQELKIVIEFFTKKCMKCTQNAHTESSNSDEVKVKCGAVVRIE